MKEEPHNPEQIQKKAERVAYLIAGQIRGTLTAEELDELDEWITESDENLELFEELTDEDNIEMGIERYMQLEKGKVAALRGIKEKIGLQPKRRISRIWPLLAAASLLLLAVSYFLFSIHPTGKKKIEKPIEYTAKNDFQAGSDKAVLTLSDGRTVILDSNGAGTVANEGRISINKSSAGELTYTGTDETEKYNVVSTPRGGQYKVVLSDGTKVWLNAESSLKFPAGFADTNRMVELKGEGYFEVAKDAARPFKVTILTPSGDGGTVEVLGTHFDIDGYGDEGIVKTTLLEGAVRVQKGGATKMLTPGEQAQVNNEINVIKTNANDANAWKDERFLFRNATARSIGEQIKRWYDVDVEYVGTITQHFNLEISRKAPLSKLLDGFEGTGQIHFTLQGRKLVIKP